MGDVTWGSGCSSTHKRVIQKALWYGRVAAHSLAFQQCVGRAMQTGHAGKGPYRKCRDEPSATEPLATQIQKAVAIGRSANGWKIACDGDAGYASAHLGPYGLTGPEEITFNRELFSADARRAGLLHADGLAPYPWIAEALWHEAYHQHGYDHGASRSTTPAQVERENAKYCGYDGDPNYHYQVNSLPYIAGRCISKVLEDAESACGLIERCSVNSSLMLTTGIDSTTCACVPDPNPNAVRPLADDADHDGTRNDKDNCPYSWNPEQENCNAQAEKVRNEEVLGDACDPVPCPSTETPHRLNAVSCVPNPPPAQDTEACTGTREQNELIVRALGPHKRDGGSFRNRINSGTASFIPTDFRFCQNNPALGLLCDREEVIADDQLDFFPSAEAETLSYDHPWHRVTMQSYPRGASQSWTYGSSAGYASYNTKWMYGSDLPFWLGRPTGPTIWTPDDNPSCSDGDGNCLNGSFWLHARTNLGVTSSVANGIDFGAHGEQLSNAYVPIRPSRGNLGWCPIPMPFDLVGGRRSVEDFNLGPSPLLTQSSLLWRDTGTKRRVDVRDFADTELIVSTTARSTNVFGALQDSGSVIALQGSQLSQNCGGDSITTSLATSLRTAPHWLSSVEPDARIGGLSSGVMAVALSHRHRTIVDAALAANDTLISTIDLSSVAQVGSIASLSSNGSAVSSADEIVGGGVLPSDRDGWIPIFSRAAEGIFLMGSSPSELWFKQLGAGHTWTQLNANILPSAGTILAATYSFRDRHLWMLHQGPNDAAVCLYALDPWDDSPDGTSRSKVGCWNYSGVDVYLTVDRQGDVLVTASGDLGAGPVTGTARIGFDAQLQPYISATAVTSGVLAYPPIVSRRSYAFVTRAGAAGFSIERRADLTPTTSPLSTFQTYMGKSCGSLQVAANLPSPQAAGTSITFTASSACDPGVTAEYRFWRRAPGHNDQLVQDWGPPSYTWNTAGLDSGTHTIRVDMRRSGSATGYDAPATLAYSIAAATGGCEELTSWLGQGVVGPSSPISVRATATCSQGAVPQYRVELTTPSGAGYVLQNWASTVSSSFANPSTELGQYVVTVLARRQGSTADYHSRSDIGLTVRRGTCEVVVASGPNPVMVGVSNSLSAQATCTLGAQPEYRFLITSGATGQTTVIRGRSTNPQFSWSPTGFPYGTYTQRVEARRSGSSAEYEGVGTRPFRLCSVTGAGC